MRLKTAVVAGILLGSLGAGGVAVAKSGEPGSVSDPTESYRRAAIEKLRLMDVAGADTAAGDPLAAWMVRCLLARGFDAAYDASSGDLRTSADPDQLIPCFAELRQ